MSYSEMAQLELMNALNNINSEAELNEFKDLVALYFAKKAQKAIDALWDEGVINEETIEQWGAEHMRTPYRYAAHQRPPLAEDCRDEYPRISKTVARELTSSLSLSVVAPDTLES